MKNWILSCCIVFLLPIGSQAQLLTGTWEGEDISGNYCRITLLHIGDSLYGVSYDTDRTGGYCRCEFEGRYDDDKRKLKGKNTQILQRTPNHVMSFYDLRYIRDGEREYLRGDITPRSQGLLNMIMNIAKTPVTYRRIRTEIDTTPRLAEVIAWHQQKEDPKPPVINEPKSDSIVKVPAPPKDSPIVIIPAPVEPKPEPIVTKPEEIKPDPKQVARQQDSVALQSIRQKRISKLAQTFTVESEQIKLILFDNGDIDGDTVTIFVNDQILYLRLGLTEKPEITFIPAPAPGTKTVIELVANNLGSIPPNTAYMKIVDGKKEYEIRLSSDNRLNAKVELVRKQ